MEIFADLWLPLLLLIFIVSYVYAKKYKSKKLKEANIRVFKEDINKDIIPLVKDILDINDPFKYIPGDKSDMEEYIITFRAIIKEHIFFIHFFLNEKSEVCFDGKKVEIIGELNRSVLESTFQEFEKFKKLDN